MKQSESYPKTRIQAVNVYVCSYDGCRTNSPVDLGLWSELIDQRSLIIPLDTHVIQQSLQLGLITSKTASMSVARKLTNKLLEIFPNDPLKADFALFGYGVNQK